MATKPPRSGTTRAALAPRVADRASAAAMMGYAALGSIFMAVVNQLCRKSDRLVEDTRGLLNGVPSG